MPAALRLPFRLPRPWVPLALALFAVLLVAAPAAAQAPIAWAPCPTAGYECSTVAVPLDRTGAVVGTIPLAVTRVPAASNPQRTAVVALAGGPGQAAVPLAQDFAAILQPAIATRDLLVFDQRGTGSSGALDCPALHQQQVSILKATSGCAAQLGINRAFYRTADSVEDIEALRLAGGYDKLVLFGVSYGTKVALAYAAAHPAQVESLVLDSVVLPEGPDPFQRSTLADSTRVVNDLCGADACRSATTNVGRDLARTAAKLLKGRLRGKVITTSGRRASYSMDQVGLLDILLAGDLNPTLRAELPGSMRAALTGDPVPLLRLSVRSEGLTTGLQSAAGDSDALFLATTCEEMAFPWTRAADATQRSQEIGAIAQQIPRDQLGPFAPSTALLGGPIRFCLGWPNAAPAPAPPGALPQVPTLILDGALDLRTPYEDGVQLATRIPGATVVKVPYTGHSVLTADLSGCATAALAAFFAGAVPGPCPEAANPFSPTARPPRKLGNIRAKSRRQRTLIAAVATVTDARRQIIGDAYAIGSVPKRVAGLRGGNATVTSQTYRLHAYEYVTGVKVSGTANLGGSATITLRGGGALSGTLRIGANGSISGRLGGRKVAIAASSAVGSDLPSLASVLKAPRLDR